jgi:hypothetical protein
MSQCTFCTEQTPFEPHMCDDTAAGPCDQCGVDLEIPRLSTENPDFTWWCDNCVGNELAGGPLSEPMTDK